MNILTIFLTGLLTGGLSCMAVQGSLLTIAITSLKEKQEVTNKNIAILLSFFLFAKIFAYTLLGFLLGFAGSFFQLSLTTNAMFQIAISIFMVACALNLLEVHPIFRYTVVKPPKFILRLLRNKAKDGQIYALLLGAFTVFIPCGTTQAMMALSVASGNPINGSLILFFFVLGTIPVFAVLGFTMGKLADSFQKYFRFAAAFAIIFLATVNINNALAVVGNPFSQKEAVVTLEKDSQQTANQIKINIVSTGYEPELLTVKKGEKVTLTVENIDARGCQQAFTIPSLGIQKIIPPGQKETFQFTAPDKDFDFMCSMGMYRGKIKVI